MSKQEVNISNYFYETTSDVFKTLIGYEIGEVKETDSEVIVRFDKKIENVFISRQVMFSDDGIHITDDYVLDILPKEEQEI